ncbi:metal ABC transporter permease [Xylanibacillus composti]|uniref:Zinc ABC transporter permease n=1 Tax=Xylanibacillus composti TaxID=1572762 RepID=A0A8J4H6S2_9BACL|nr:metal ABC transporter permease [Xylanibacillus composti]MDT9726260.1 metal ABC transporter permease [Xylanibacillus composti]GIQ70711.1 zinc ABC transporter permease [Xylanibacillus composti]
MDIFAYDFFQRALIGGILIGLMTPLIGTFVVLRRLSMIGDTLAHVSIAGVALGFLIDVYPLGMGLVFAVVAAFAIEKLRRAYKGYAELSIAILLSGGVALASILFTLGKGFNMNVNSYLFGNILSLSKSDLVLVTVVTIAVLIAVLVLFKELFLMALDEDAASVNGLPLSLLNILTIVLTALVVSVAIKIVGALLISALLTIPVACSLVFGRGFKHTVLISVLISEIAVIGGLSISGVWNLAPGGTIVMLLIVMLMLLLLARRSLRV